MYVHMYVYMHVWALGFPYRPAQGYLHFFCLYILVSVVSSLEFLILLVHLHFALTHSNERKNIHIIKLKQHVLLCCWCHLLNLGSAHFKMAVPSNYSDVHVKVLEMFVSCALLFKSCNQSVCNSVVRNLHC